MGETAHDVTEPVEIKITIGGANQPETVATAVQLLQLSSRPATRQIWFLEDTGHDARPQVADCSILESSSDCVAIQRANPTPRSSSGPADGPN